MLGQDQHTFAATAQRHKQQQPMFADDNAFGTGVGYSLNIVPQFGEQPKIPGRSHRQQLLAADGDSSGLGAQSNDHGLIRGGLTDKSLELRQMVRGSLNSDDDDMLTHNMMMGAHNVGLDANEDLTLDMLGGGNQYLPYQQRSYQPITSKEPPSSALNLLANMEPTDSRGNLQPQQPSYQATTTGSEPAMSLEQYRQNNANLQQILMQFDSTPQFNPNMMPTTNNKAGGADSGSLKQQQSRGHLGAYQPTGTDSVKEVSSFNYTHHQQQQQTFRQQNNQAFLNAARPDANAEIEKIRDNLSKIEMLQHAIQGGHQTQQESARHQKIGLQAAGFQIVSNENKNFTNNDLQLLKNKSAPIPDESLLKDQHKKIMRQFDDIPISKIKTMVGYQTNADMYKSGAKLPPDEVGAHDALRESQGRADNQPNDSDESEGEEGMSIEERAQSAQWKTRLRATKQINQLFYNDYACQQTEPDHVMSSFDQYGPMLQELIKDTNLTIAAEALQCLHSFVKFANDIRQVSFSCHVYLLEKVSQSVKPMFRDVTVKILLCMLGRLHGPTNTILSALLQRLVSKNVKCATLCYQVLLEAIKTKETAVTDINLRHLFRQIQPGLTDKNKEIRESSYAVLKFICERCRDEPAIIVQNCKNLRPVQIKEFSDDLSKITKLPNNSTTLFEDNNNLEAQLDQQERDSKLQKTKSQLESAAEPIPQPKQCDEMFDLSTLVPDDFAEVPYAQQIAAKKKAMEAFNSELAKIVEKQAQVKQRDYSFILNVIFHLLEEKNMLVYLESIKSVELLTILGQIKKERVKSFILVLAGKYGETKTAVIAATDRTLAAILKHALSPAQFADIVCNQIASTHKNPRVKQFLLTNPLCQMLQKIDRGQVCLVFRGIQKNIVTLIQKDNNDAVRNAAVQLLVEFGLLMQNDELFMQQLQQAIMQLPKGRQTEINRKLMPQQPGSDVSAANATTNEQQFAKTMPPQQKQQPQPMQATEDDEFSKTLVPAVYESTDVQPVQFFNQLMQLIKSLPLKTSASLPLLQTMDTAAQQPDVYAYLQQNRALLVKVFSDVITTNAKPLKRQSKAHIMQIVNLLKQLFIRGEPANDFVDLIQVGVVMLELGVDQADGVASSLLSLALDSCVQQDCTYFVDMLRQCVETQAIMQMEQAIQIIVCVYTWLSLKLGDFVQMGMSHTEMEELRGIGIKYLEETRLYSEQQRQALISVMIRFKDQIQQFRSEQTLQTLGQVAAPESQQSHRSLGTMDARQPTAQFVGAEESTIQQVMPPPQKPQITGHLICQTIDKEFEQGLLMFKELAQSAQGLDFETKEMIFEKLLGIVSESPLGQQQQYRQAYALKAIMWMKEETMGLEDTFKLAPPILAIYMRQVQRQSDASVELYLLNFWARDLTPRDLSDRIFTTVQTFKAQSRQSSARHPPQHKGSSEEQLEAFCVLFCWLCEHKLDPAFAEFKLSDLRKIALLVCECALSVHARQTVQKFLAKVVQRDGADRVLEFMEIQLMHSNETLMHFTDWFSGQFRAQNAVPSVNLASVQQPKRQTEQLSDRLAESSTQHQSYAERRHQKKESNLTKAKQSEMVQRERLDSITKGEESLHPQQDSTIEVTARASRYDQMQHRSESQYHDSTYEEPPRPSQHLQDSDDMLPLEEIKQTHTPRKQQASIAKLDQANASLQERVMQSEAKQRDWVKKILELEGEKRRIEAETEKLKQHSDLETQQWQSKLSQMQAEHRQVASNLSEVNQCYLQQVDENEKLKQQLLQMQSQHAEMLSRFEQIERKIQSREPEQPETQRVRTPPRTPPRSARLQKSRDQLMSSVAKLQRISDTFAVQDVSRQTGINKICELLLSVERNVDGELARPLIAHYTQIDNVDDRLAMIMAIGDALSLNEDILYALSTDVYKALLNFLLRAFAHEKERLDTQSQGHSQKLDQNQVTCESQKVVSRLLNSKDFTVSLVVLFQLLREAMPRDLEPALAVEEGQYLRVLMRCITRITKALQTESAELVRGFDVLLEMQKIFVVCPPENLREHLPSLADFDFVFRGMKDVSDKLVQLQPEKVLSFLGFCDTRSQPENAFMKYLRMKTR